MPSEQSFLSAQAFDALVDAAVMLDDKGLILMANKAFRALSPSTQALPADTPLSSLPWIAAAWPGDKHQHPWARVMAPQASGNAVELMSQPSRTVMTHLTMVSPGTSPNRQPEHRQFRIHAAPIIDSRAAVQGCIVTFQDVSDLHRTNDALRATVAHLQASHRELQAKVASLEQPAPRDPLTGVVSHHALSEAFRALASQAKARQLPIACLMLDIDHFDFINEHHGRVIGDRVTQEVARRLQDSVRGVDLVARSNKAAFCIVTLGLDVDAAFEFAERVRRRIEREAGLSVREVPDLRITCSIGVTSVVDGDVTLERLEDHAARALNQAARAGRNCSQSWAGPASVVDEAPDDGTSMEPLDAGSNSEPVREALRDGVAWKAAREWLMKQARDADRGIACLVASLDAAQRGAESADANPNAHSTAAIDVDQLERWALSLAPRRSVVARTASGEVVVLVVGWGLQDIHTCAMDLQRRVQRGHPKMHLGLCIGLDALPSRAVGAATLPERAAKAMVWQRQTHGSGVATFGAIAAPSAKGRAR